MTLLRVCSAMFGLLAIAAAQDGLTAVATRNVSLTPTEAALQISVSTDSAKTLDDVLAKVKDAGLTVENLYTVTTTPGVPSPAPGVPGVAGRGTYTFRLNVPLAQATATLQRMQQFSAANPEFRTDAGVAAVSASPAAIHEAQQRHFPELFREAKARAEEMARSAGLSPGRVLAVADSYQVVAVATIYTALQVPLAVAVRLAID